MRIEDLILLTYSSMGGEIQGKTKLQKTFYFLSVELNYDLGYDAHYYGPYSAMIAEMNSDLKAYGYLKETCNHTGIYSKGFEVVRYDYVLSEEAKEIIEKLKLEYADEWKKISEFSQKFKSTGDIDYMVLSIAAKAYFILKKENSLTSDDKIKELAKNFGWEFSNEDLIKALQFLEAMNFVETVA